MEQIQNVCINLHTSVLNHINFPNSLKKDMNKLDYTRGGTGSSESIDEDKGEVQICGTSETLHSGK